MNEGWQLVTTDMMDWVREVDRETSIQPNSNEWVFALENRRQDAPDGGQASRKRRADRGKYLNRRVGILSSTARKRRLVLL